jgi:hypothetical protein
MMDGLPRASRTVAFDGPIEMLHQLGLGSSTSTYYGEPDRRQRVGGES